MLGRTKFSLLFIGRETIARGDFDGRGRRRGVWTRVRPLAGELPELIDIAAHLDRAPLGKTWILADDLWTHRLSIGREQLAGLATAEITRALGFEAESLSGQSALDSDLGLRRLEGTRDAEEFWVMQAPHWVRDQAEAIVARARGRLAGMLHPGGAPGRLENRTSSPLGWGRLERWGSATIAVGAAPDGKTHFALAGADARTATAKGLLDRWRLSLGADAEVEQLSESGQALLAGDRPPLRLAQPEVLDAWLELWARTLAQPAPPVPYVAPPKRPVSAGARYAVGVALFLLVAGVGSVDYVVTAGRIRTLELQIKHRRLQEQELAAAGKQLKEWEKKAVDEGARLASLQEAVPAAEAAQETYRRRWSALLSLLHDGCPNDVVIREISRNGRAPTIKGVSLGLEPLNELVVEFGRKLTPLGWTLVPRYEIDQVSASGRPLYRFQIELTNRPLEVDARPKPPEFVSLENLLP
ncbi:MAG: hypothetical protein U0939_12575 [Pirellulales bacterium]